MFILSRSIRNFRGRSLPYGLHLRSITFIIKTLLCNSSLFFLFERIWFVILDLVFISPLPLGLGEIMSLDSWLIIFKKKTWLLSTLWHQALVNFWNSEHWLIFFMKDGLYAVRPWWNYPLKYLLPFSFSFYIVFYQTPLLRQLLSANFD